MKALLIGSDFMEELYDYLDFFDTKIIIENESPLADDFNFMLKEIKEDVDCVLVDLMVCATWLFKSSGKFKTLKDEQDEKYIFDPAMFKCTQFNKNFELFINNMLERFSSDKIFVMEASLPPYFVAQFQLRNINKADYISEWKKSFKYIKKLEKTFISKTNATVIKLSQYYFVKKKAGYVVSFVRYEDLLYKDINQWFYDYQNGVLRDKALFRFKLDRYIMYQYKTIHYKAFYRFISEEILIDKLLLSSPRQYLIDNYENIMRLNVLVELQEKQLKNENLHDLVQMDKILTENFKKVVLALLVLQKSSIFEEPSEFFKEMFKNSIVPNNVKREIRNYWSKYGINPNIITNHNAGYYYMKMRGDSDAKGFIADQAVVKPTLVDVYGSCIAYQTINEFISGATEVVHNNYYMHVPVYESSEFPVEHPEVTWEGEPADEFEKNVRIQFEHQIEEDLKKSDATWCLVDLFSLIAPRTFLYKNFCFTDYGNKTWQKFDAQNIHPWNGYYQKLLQSEDFLKRIEKWAEWLKKKYGDNIILINFKVSQYKIGDDNNLYYAYKNAKRKNEVIDKVYDLVRNWLNCYCIDFGKEFLADDIGYSSSASIHYELDFYEVEATVIQNIIATKPEQKVYEVYPNTVRVNRILRLVKNNHRGLLGQIFKSNLDKIIVSLPTETIECYKSEIINFYNQKIDNKMDLLKGISLLEAKDPYYYYNLKKSVLEAEEIHDDIVGEIKTNYNKTTEMLIYDKYKDNLMKNTSYTIEFYEGKNFLFKQEVIYGVKAKLLPVPEDDRNFLGWKAYRMSDGKVACIQEDGKKAFISEEKLDEKNTLYLFPNGADVAKNSNVDGDIIRMYAIWQQDLNKKDF